MFDAFHLLQVPTSLCSPECHTGYVKKQTGNEECCFSCDICEDGTYINSTGKLKMENPSNGLGGGKTSNGYKNHPHEQ